LVVNEAAAAELPLVVSNRAGCASTFVPQAEKSTGRLIDPVDVADIADALAWIASLDEQQRLLMGQRARGVVAVWGPTRFADGALEAIQVASGRAHARRFRHAISR
jgi:glycosyltransferase involved in cell wall biosynthesis